MNRDRWQRYWLDRHRNMGKKCRERRLHDPIGVWVPIVTTNVDVRLGVQITVKRPRDSVFFKVNLTTDGVEPDLVRLENRSESIIIGLRKRVVLMVVTFRTIESQAEHRLSGMLNGLIQPTCPIEFKILSAEEPACPKLVEILRIQFICRQHLAQHLVVSFI